MTAEDDAEARAVPVTVEKAAKKTMTRQLSATGSILAFADAAVVSEVAGVIEDLPIEKGQEVKKGQMVAIVEHAEASARVLEAEAALQAAQAQVLQAEAKLRNVEVEHSRVSTLFADGVASQQMLDAIDANRDVAAAAKEMAVAQVAQAGAALQHVRVYLENHTVCSPMEGVVTARYVDAGDKNNPSEPIISIARMDPVKVVCDFPERDLPFLKCGQVAYLEVDAYPAERFPAEVKIVSPSMDSSARTVAVELWAPNGEGRLRAGMFARVVVLGEEVEVLAVPDDALTRIPGTGVEFLFVIDDSTARRVDVQRGRHSGGWTEVSGALAPADLVVVEGQNNLRSGASVRIVSDMESQP